MARFTTSDIIAIVAILVSGIISLTTIISNVLINHASISAKRDEMAFTEQLKAFSSIVEQVTDIEYQRNSLRDLPLRERESITKQVQEIDDKISKLVKTTIGFSILLPPYISREIVEYIHAVSDSLASQASLEERVNKISLCKPSVQFIGEMRKFIGLKE